MALCLSLLFALTSCLVAPSGPDVESDVAFVFTERFEPFIGGMPTAVRRIYFSEDGLLQVSEETDAAEITTLKETHVAGQDLFRDLREEWRLPRTRLHRVMPGLEVDGGPAQVRVTVGVPGEPLQVWEGEPADMPARVRAIAETVQGLAEGAAASEADSRYVRAYPLARSTQARLKDANALPRVSAGTLTPILRRAIETPFRLHTVNDSAEEIWPTGLTPNPEIRALNIQTDLGSYRIVLLMLVELSQ